MVKNTVQLFEQNYIAWNQVIYGKMTCFENLFPETGFNHAIMRNSAASSCQSVLSCRPGLQGKRRQIYLQEIAHSKFEWFKIFQHVTSLSCKTHISFTATTLQHVFHNIKDWLYCKYYQQNVTLKCEWQRDISKHTYNFKGHLGK
jgi:hypothetical protein